MTKLNLREVAALRAILTWAENTDFAEEQLLFDEEFEYAAIANVRDVTERKRQLVLARKAIDKLAKGM